MQSDAIIHAITLASRIMVLLKNDVVQNIVYRHETRTYIYTYIYTYIHTNISINIYIHKL